MDHGDVKTTMAYVHANSKARVDAVKEIFGEWALFAFVEEFFDFPLTANLFPYFN